MKNTIRLALLAQLFIASTIAYSANREIDTELIDLYVNEYLQKTGLPGVAIAIVKNETVVYTAGYGHDSLGNPITADTMLPVASVSKSFTSLALMQLVDAGKIGLDLPVIEFLPDFTMADSRYKGITVRQLLNQTSGMSDTGFPEKSSPQPDTLRESVDRLHNAELTDDPGTNYHYHNPNYQIAARLVEVVSDEPFDEYMKRHIFNPLEMYSTRVINDLGEAQDIPKGYARAYNQSVALPEPPFFLGGSSGVVTNANDFAKWLILNINEGELPDGARIISHESAKEIITASSVQNYGLGWKTYPADDGSSRLAHEGWLFTFTVFFKVVVASIFMLLVFGPSLYPGSMSQH